MIRRLIKHYKICIHPLFPDSCIYTPSCSAYMIQAVEKRGILAGVPLGLWRILRCNPFSRGGFDPVGENYRGMAKWIL